MLLQYVHILLFCLIGVAFPASLPIIASLVRARGESPDNSPYECGMDAVGQAWSSPNIRFYVFCLLFVLFDVETLFVFPWAVQFRALGMTAYLEVLAFVGILALGLLYAWRKKVLRWI